MERFNITLLPYHFDTGQLRQFVKSSLLHINQTTTVTPACAHCFACSSSPVPPRFSLKAPPILVFSRSLNFLQPLSQPELAFANNLPPEKLINR